MSSVVTWLCSEASSRVTGQVIEAEGGRIAIADGWRSTRGVDKGARWAPADVGDALDEAMSTAVPPQQVWGS